MIYWLCSSIPAKHLQYQCSTLITDRILDQAILSTAHCELETHFLSWTLKTALELGRVSNLPTVWTNTLAGLALSGSTATDWRLPVVLVSMTAAYTGGMVLNDAFDAAIDSEQRPERPIPSGTVSVASVFVAGFALLGVSVLLIAVCAFSGDGGGWKAVGSAIALCAAITLYNAWHKGNTLGPLIMGSCRMLVYVTAGLTMMSQPDEMLYLGATLSLCYLIGLTYTAKQENLGVVKNMWPLLFLLSPVLFALITLSAQTLVLLPSAILALWLVVVMRYLTRRQAGDIPRAVVSMIAGISLMDAVFIAATGNIVWMLLAITGFFLTLTLQKWIAGT